MNYQKVDSEFLVAGIALTSWPYATQARRKRLREMHDRLVRRAELDNAVASYRASVQEARDEVSLEKEQLLREYADREQFKTEFLTNVREDIQRGLSFIHDYKQINSQISQNINVLLEQRQGATLDEKLANAPRAERAIYESARFLKEKLDVTQFLVHPERLLIPSACSRFRVHSLVIKYVKIYQSWFEKKFLRMSVSGTSYAEILANPEACGVIPHTFIDNAVKYSPRGGRIEIYVGDEDQGVYFSVSSYGPKILPEERNKVFWCFYRGKAAQEAEEEGAGFGLYLSQLVAKEHLGVSITVQQEADPDPTFGYWTTFEVVFPNKAAVIP